MKKLFYLSCASIIIVISCIIFFLTITDINEPFIQKTVIPYFHTFTETIAYLIGPVIIISIIIAILMALSQSFLFIYYFMRLFLVYFIMAFATMFGLFFMFSLVIATFFPFIFTTFIVGGSIGRFINSIIPLPYFINMLLVTLGAFIAISPFLLLFSLSGKLSQNKITKWFTRTNFYNYCIKPPANYKEDTKENDHFE
jgi:hypothetical protein